MRVKDYDFLLWVKVFLIKVSVSIAFIWLVFVHWRLVNINIFLNGIK